MAITTPSDIYLDFDAFLRSIKQNLDGSFGVLLGAGASISSGIQSANDCIWDWKASIYQTLSGCQQNLVDPKKSDRSKTIIQKWIDSQIGFPKEGSSDEYSFYAEKAYQIEADRIKYFQNLCQDKTPYVGYKLLCLLNKYGVVKSIWSTNFDGLVERAAQQANITPITINLDCVDRIYRTESSNELLYIALHGDYKYSTLKNTAKELDSQHTDFVSAMCRYFVDKNLIVIGYSGRDKSLMDALTRTFTDKGAGRLYWCGYGGNITPEVQELITNIRKAGRTAYYIDADGFDNIMLSLMKYCYNEDPSKQNEINEILKIVRTESTDTPFCIGDGTTIKYLKSNLSPVVFPKEIFQFHVSFDKTKGKWQYIREKTNNTSVVAVPYQDKVYSISTASMIQDIFGNDLISEIERIPITVDDIESNGVFRELILKAILLGISQLKGLNVNYKRGILWKNESIFKEENIIVHEAVECGLSFIPQKEYALFSITPTIYLESSEPIEKEKKQKYTREYLDRMRNKKYEEKLQMWYNIILGNNKTSFDIPLNSNSGFTFKLSPNRGYAEIIGHNGFKTHAPKEFDKRRTIYRGIHVDEPKLEFINSYADRPFYDDNPMRGLTNHKPFDSRYYDKLAQDIRIGVICPGPYSTIFSTFLKRLNSTINTSQTSDYIHDYTGFSNIYNCRLDIPEVNSERWLSINDNPSNVLELVRAICFGAKKLAEQTPGSVITIFIPSSWSHYRQFKHEHETFDLHNYIKAYAAHHKFTTQIIEEKTLSDRMECEISWWLSLALFVKALRTPWTLADLNPDTAYAGIGYSIKKKPDGKTDVVLGCSHIYNSQGQGLRYKLSKVEHPQFDSKRNPYLNFEEAYKFGMDILNLFQHAMEKLPKRVVIHKRTPYKKDEIEGITHALRQAGILEVDLITITNEQNHRFISQWVNNKGEMCIDGYPIDRGTCIKLSNRKALLWTHGVVPSIKANRKYYQGGRSIPSPLKITKYYGTGDLKTIAKEIIGFTKMNWNSFNLYTKLPATIDTSNTLAQIGNLLKQYKGITYDYRYFI